MEVHISDITARGGLPAGQLCPSACVATVMGKGTAGYLEAMDVLLKGETAAVTVTIYPSTAGAKCPLPPLQSCGHRMLLCSALADGESVIRGIPRQDKWLPWTVSGARCLPPGGRHGVYHRYRGPGRRKGSIPLPRAAAPPLLYPAAPYSRRGGRLHRHPPAHGAWGVGIYEGNFPPKGIAVVQRNRSPSLRGHLPPGIMPCGAMSVSCLRLAAGPAAAGR